MLNALPLYFDSEFSWLITCFRLLTVGFSRWGSGFSPKAFHVEIVVNNVALRQVFVPVRRCFPASYHCTSATHLLNVSSQGWATSLVDVPFTQKLFLQRYSLCRGGNDSEWLRMKKNSRSEFLQIPHVYGTTKLIAMILLHHTFSWTYWIWFIVAGCLSIICANISQLSKMLGLQIVQLYVSETSTFFKIFSLCVILISLPLIFIHSCYLI